MRLLILALLGLVLVGGLPACGGGGSEEETGTADCTVPGVLRRLAGAGFPAPGTTGGNFAAFPLQPAMAAARGGWVGFVAQTTDLTKTSVCYVAQPDGTVVDTFAVGDTVPDAGGGTISAIEAVRVNPAGRVLALVSITGDAGSKTRGLLTALVSGGAAGAKDDVVYNATTAIPLGGNFTDFVAANLFLADDGYTFFEGITTTGDEGLYRVAPDGTSLTLLAGTGTTVSGTAAIDTIETVTLGPGATRYAFLTERDDGAAGIYVGALSASGHEEIVEEGDPVDVDQIADLSANQSLSLSASGWVYFRAETLFLIDLLMVGAVGSDPIVIVAEGFDEPNTGGDYQDPRWLRNHYDAGGFMFTSDLGTNDFGIDVGIFGVSDQNLAPRFLISDGGSAAALEPGELFGTVFPGLGAAQRYDVGPAASLAFANVLNSGRTGLFWRVPGIECLIVTVAAGGQEAAGDTFTSGAGWAAATAEDVIVFRAPLVSAGSGIFRQGPN